MKFTPIQFEIIRKEAKRLINLSEEEMKEEVIYHILLIQEQNRIALELLNKLDNHA